MLAESFPELIGQYLWLVACRSMTMCLSVRQDLGGFQLSVCVMQKCFGNVLSTLPG